MIKDLLNNPMVMALGWTLVHSLWLALSLALIIRIAQHFISADRAVLRYRMGLAAMLTLLVGSAVIFLHYFQVYEGLAAFAVLPEATEATVTTIMEFDALGTPEAPAAAGFTMEYFIQQLESYFPFLVVAWLIGALLMGLRLAGSWMYLNNLGKKGIQNPTDEWNLLFRDLCTKMGIQRPVRFFISDRVQEPITLRHLKPIVLFPIGLVTQLSIEQVEVVLLHELAHIKRWDYLVNWVQSLLELLFFYHPAVWWLSGQVRTAREHCCDDLVLQAGNQQKMLYAQTLTQVSAYSLNFKSKLAMSLSGKNNNSFTFRVKRLFGQVDQRFDWQKSMISGLLVLFVVLVALFNTSALFADENEPLDTELWDLINDEVSQMELEAEFILDTIAEPKYGTADNPKREPMIMINRQFVGYGDAGKAKLDPSTDYKVYEFMAEWAVLDFGEQARWGAFNYVTPKQEAENAAAFVASDTEKEALVEGAKNLFGINDALFVQDTTPLYILDGVVMKKGESINDLDPNNIASVTVLKGKSAIESYGQNGQYGAILIKTKNDVKKAETKDKPTVVVTGRATENGISKSPLVVIDGLKKGFGKEKISKLDPKDIATVNVFKGEAAVKAYGEDGRNGVIVVVTKANAVQKDQPQDKATSSFIKIRSNSDDADEKNPLIVVNGEVVDKLKSKTLEELNINPNDIKEMSVLKDKSAVTIYGEAGKDGVVVIDLKKGKSFEMPEENAATMTVKVRGDKNKDPLYVIDGEIIGRKGVDLLEIDPNDIESINIIKGEAAVKKYGEEGKNGVVDIGMKKGKSFDISGTNTSAKPTTIGKKGNTDLLFVLNDKVIGHRSDFELEFDRDAFKSRKYLDSEAAIKKYGHQGAGGAIEYTLKKSVNNTSNPFVKVKPHYKVTPRPLREIRRSPGDNLTQTEFLYAKDKDAPMKKMNPLIVLGDEVLGKKSKVEHLVKTADIDHIIYSGPLQRDLQKYGPKAKDGVAYISRQKADKVNLKGELKDITQKGDVALRVDFKGKVTIDNGKGKENTYQIDKMSFELKDLEKADTQKKTSPMKFSSEEGIDIQAFLNNGGNHPLVLLDGIPVKAGSNRIQNLDPSTVKSVELIESGPALIPYGEAAKYGILKINTKEPVVIGRLAEPSMENGMDIADEFEDSKFWFGPKGNTKNVDPLLVVNGVAKGLHSKVSKNYPQDVIATVTFSGPTPELLEQFGKKAKDGVVTVYTKDAADQTKEQFKVTVPPFQKELEASLKVFPNPFGKETRINFNLPEAARTKVSVFNAQGQLVKVLQDAQLQAGLHQVDWNSERSPSGNYTLVIESLNTRITKTIIKQ